MGVLFVLHQNAYLFSLFCTNHRIWLQLNTQHKLWKEDDDGVQTNNIWTKQKRKIQPAWNCIKISALQTYLRFIQRMAKMSGALTKQWASVLTQKKITFEKSQQNLGICIYKGLVLFVYRNRLLYCYLKNSLLFMVSLLQSMHLLIVFFSSFFYCFFCSTQIDFNVPIFATRWIDYA